MPEAASLAPGTTLRSGQYRIDGVLGQGGFGITYAGTDLQLDRSVAIKEFFPAGSSRTGTTVLPSSAFADVYQERMDRVRDEARALARFRHPSIVTVHEYFEENDTIYVVMEMLGGQSLRAMLDDKSGPLPLPEVLEFGRQVADALTVVHAENLLHRDIKPDNIVVESGRAVLIDFGTARQYALDATSEMSQTLSPGYAPVEQYVAQGHFGPPTDVYALGATLYHLATGKLPTPSLDRYTGSVLQPPQAVNPSIPKGISDAIVWAMELEAERRPQTAAAFAAAIGAVTGQSKDADDDATRIVAAEDSATRLVPPDVSTAAPTPLTQAPPRQQPVRHRRRKRIGRKAVRTIANFAITLAVGVTATVALAFFMNRDSGTTTTLPPVSFVDVVTRVADGFDAGSTAADLDGVVVCTVPHHRSALQLAVRNGGAAIEIQDFDTIGDAFTAFRSGTCGAVTSDGFDSVATSAAGDESLVRFPLS